jgi:hypothetical protein
VEAVRTVIETELIVLTVERELTVLDTVCIATYRRTVVTW